MCIEDSIVIELTDASEKFHIQGNIINNKRFIFEKKIVKIT